MTPRDLTIEEMKAALPIQAPGEYVVTEVRINTALLRRAISLLEEDGKREDVFATVLGLQYAAFAEQKSLGGFPRPQQGWEAANARAAAFAEALRLIDSERLTQIEEAEAHAYFETFTAEPGEDIAHPKETP